MFPLILGALAVYATWDALSGQSSITYPWTGGGGGDAPGPTDGNPCQGPPGDDRPHQWAGGQCVPSGGFSQPSPIVLPPGQIDVRAPPAAAVSTREVYLKAALLGLGVFLGLRVLGAVAKATWGPMPESRTIIERPIIVTTRRKKRTRYIPGERAGKKGVFIQKPGSRAMTFRPFPRRRRR